MPPVGPSRGAVIQAPTLPPILLARAPAPTRQQVQVAAYRAAPPVYTKPAYVPPPAPRALTTGANPRGTAIVQPPSYPTISDVKANAFKQSPAYKQSVLETFLHQAPHQREAIVTGALKNTAAPESKMILDYVKQTGGGPTGGSNLVSPALYANVIRTTTPKGSDLLTDIGKGVNWLQGLTPGPGAGLGLGGGGVTLPPGAAGKVISGGLGAASSALDKAQALGQAISPTVGPGGGARVGAAGLALPPGVSRAITHTPINAARAAAEDPKTIPKTLAGLADLTAGMIAGPAEAAWKAGEQGSLSPLLKIPGQVVADYAKRYGPVAAGNDRAQINRFKKEGAAPEVFDYLALAGGADATVGRAISAVARAREGLRTVGDVGQAAKEARFTAPASGPATDAWAPRPAPPTGTGFFTRPRPDLLLSGNKVRPQVLAPTAGRAAAQRLEDFIRSKKGGELIPQPGQVAPIFQTKAIRVVHSGIAQQARRVLGEVLNREVRGYKGSALDAMGKLSNVQQEAVYHAVQGIRVDTAAHMRTDLAGRAQDIIHDRARPASLGNRIPAQYADKVDELKLIEQLSANAEKIAGPDMVKFQRGEAARAQRIEATTALHPATAEARRLRASPAARGIEHPDEMAARMWGRPQAGWEKRTDLGGATLDAQSQRAAAEYEANRAQYLAKYNAKVRAVMKEKGYPEPGYFPHSERPDVKYGDFTSGSGARGMPSDKRSTWALHRAGIANTSPDAYLQGLARSLKRPLQWRLTDAQYRAAALATPTDAEIRAALGREVTGKPQASQTPEQLRPSYGPRAAQRTNLASELTGNDLRRVLEHRGVNMDNIRFYNPGRLSERTLSDHGLIPSGKSIAETNDLTTAELHHSLQQSDIIQPGNSTDPHFMTTPGWKAIPKTAHDEIHGNLAASSKAGRVVGKGQGVTAKFILGQNPHFVIINTLAHAIPAVAGTKGRLLADLGRFPLWWHGLSDAEKDTVRAYAGGRGGHIGKTAGLGSQAPNRIAAWWRQLERRGIVQRAQHYNPFRALLNAEQLQSNFFRHAVMYHQMKRMAFQDMGHEYGRAVAQWNQVKNIFGAKDPQDRMRAIMQNQTKLEDLGRTTVNILGDYGRMTNRERTWLNNRAVLFYSFLRHVTRTLLYVLPVRHPLALGLMGELGNLHKEEVDRLLGGQSLPWAYGRMFREKNGKLSSIDLTSTSPISSPLVDLFSGGVREAPGLLSPLLGNLLNVAYGKTPLNQPIQRNAFSLLNGLLSLSYPIRVAAAGELGLGPQQSDSIPWLHERPKTYKAPGTAAYEAAKEQARGPLKDYLLGTTLGLYPKPDDSRVIAANMILKQQATQRAAAKALAPKKFTRSRRPKPTPTSVVGLAQIIQALQQGKAPPANAGVPAKRGTGGWGFVGGGASAPAASSGGGWGFSGGGAAAATATASSSGWGFKK